MFINYYCCSSTHLCKPSLKKNNKKNIKKRACSDFNTEKAQRQNWDCTLSTNHFKATYTCKYKHISIYLLPSNLT